MNIELINMYIYVLFSYSDDEEKNFKNSKLIANWAKTPNLMKALEKQKDINPDDIFGGYKPCHLNGNY